MRIHSHRKVNFVFGRERVLVISTRDKCMCSWYLGSELMFRGRGEQSVWLAEAHAVGELRTDKRVAIDRPVEGCYDENSENTQHFARCSARTKE